MTEVPIEIHNSLLQIDFGQTGLALGTLPTRVRELLPLLLELLAADDTWQSLSDPEKHLRRRGFAAIDMMCETTILAAFKKAELLRAIAGGFADISDHGFPEFADGADSLS